MYGAIIYETRAWHEPDLEDARVGKLRELAEYEVCHVDERLCESKAFFIPGIVVCVCNASSAPCVQIRVSSLCSP